MLDYYLISMLSIEYDFFRVQINRQPFPAAVVQTIRRVCARCLPCGATEKSAAGLTAPEDARHGGGAQLVL